MTCKTLWPAIIRLFEKLFVIVKIQIWAGQSKKRNFDCIRPQRIWSGYKREQISGSHIVDMAPLFKFLLLALICCSSASLEDEVVSSRSKKLFYVSTTSSTSTLNTQSICYASTTTAVVVCGKKKRKRSLDDISDYDSKDEITPTGSR